jgi:3-hydroxyisobutyrate dehydrogenase
VSDPHDLTLESATIVSMIPKLVHVQKVYTSSDASVLSALKSGSLSPDEVAATICMDESTIEMEGSRAVAQQIEQTGAGMVDAPVSGGVYGAEKGTLTIMVGASSKERFEKAKPTLELMSRKVIHCGDLGAGLAAKICNKWVHIAVVLHNTDVRTA